MKEAKKKEVIERIRQYALNHYEIGGWDVLVEAWDDEDIWDEVKEAKNTLEAIAILKVILDVYEEKRLDIQAEIF